MITYPNCSKRNFGNHDRAISLLATLLFSGMMTSTLLAAPYSAGPLLLQPGSDRMTIVIDNASPVTATLSYRNLVSDKTSSVKHNEPDQHHIFSLKGLEPGTAYQYEIKSGSFDSGMHQFRTLPLAPERYRILAVGDVRTQIEPWAQLSKQMFSDEQKALFILATGDYASDGRIYDQWVNQFFVPARAMLARFPIWPSIGSHEVTRQEDGLTPVAETQYFNLFDLPENERWYRVDYRYMTLLVIDSATRLGPTAPQYEWVRSQLRSLRKRFTLVVLHDAPFSSGPHLARLDDGTPREWKIDEARRFMVPLFELYDVDLVLSGHDHAYERSEKAGVTYMVTGGGGAPLYPINVNENRYQQTAVSAYHYISLDITPDRIETTAIKMGGEVIERHRIEVSPANLARRSTLLKKLITNSAKYDPYDAAGQTVPLLITNPYESAIEIELASGDTDIELSSDYNLKLQAGQSRTVNVDLSPFAGALTVPAWRPTVYADLNLTTNYDDEGSMLQFEIEQQPVMRLPSYPVHKIDPVIELPDLTELESILLDEGSALIDPPRSYHGSNDLNGRIRFGWRDDILYFVADISDDQISSTFAPLNEDSIYLVLKTSEGTPLLLIFSTNGNFQSNVELPEGAVKHSVDLTETGYQLRAAVPFGIFTHAKDKAFIEAGILVNDDDSPKEKGISRHRLWSSKLASTDPYGKLMLLEE